jgi:hypothetical protein
MAKSSILLNNRINIEDVKKSKKWYDTQVASMKGNHVTNASLMNDKGLKKSLLIEPGNLYFYYYDPKFKDTLPYYDAFPMVFPFATAPGGFLGLNLHYLGYAERFALFDKLIEINGSKITPNMKMKYSWATLSQFSQLKGLNNCIKHYLYEHLKSPLMKVKPVDWTTAMLLPVEKFVGAKKEYVWNQSRKM